MFFSKKQYHIVDFGKKRDSCNSFPKVKLLVLFISNDGIIQRGIKSVQRLPFKVRCLCNR